VKKIETMGMWSPIKLSIRIIGEIYRDLSLFKPRLVKASTWACSVFVAYHVMNSLITSIKVLTKNQIQWLIKS
jgi:hypothetical protein